MGEQVERMVPWESRMGKEEGKHVIAREGQVGGEMVATSLVLPSRRGFGRVDTGGPDLSFFARGARTFQIWQVARDPYPALSCCLDTSYFSTINLMLITLD